MKELVEKCKDTLFNMHEQIGKMKESYETADSDEQLVILASGYAYCTLRTRLMFANNIICIYLKILQYIEYRKEADMRVFFKKKELSKIMPIKNPPNDGGSKQITIIVSIL